jgi:hypothetical protein
MRMAISARLTYLAADEDAVEDKLDMSSWDLHTSFRTNTP